MWDYIFEFLSCILGFFTYLYSISFITLNRIKHGWFGSLRKTQFIPCMNRTTYKGVAVVLHGMNGFPSDVLGIAHQLKDFDVFCPALVHCAGNAGLEKNVSTVLNAIYTRLPPYLHHKCQYPPRHNQERVVVIVGVSNGGIVGAIVESILRQTIPKTPVLYCSVGTPFHGTLVMDVCGNVAQCLGLYTAQTIEAYRYKYVTNMLSVVFKNTLRLEGYNTQTHRDPSFSTVQYCRREYHFYIGQSDALVIPRTSALPVHHIPSCSRVTRNVVFGYGHCSMVMYLSKHVGSLIDQFIQ